MPKKYPTTIDNVQWLRENEQKIKNIFPETWTHPANINPLQLMFQTKLLGLIWSTKEELADILGRLTQIGIVQISPDELIRRSPHSIFSKESTK